MRQLHLPEDALAIAGDVHRQPRLTQSAGDRVGQANIILGEQNAHGSRLWGTMAAPETDPARLMKISCSIA